MSKPPPPAPTASAIGPCPTVIKIVGRPGTESLPSTIAPPDHPRQYFSLYRVVSQREGEKREMIDEKKNVQTTPTRTNCKRRGPFPTIIQISRTPGTESLPSNIAPPDTPLPHLKVECIITGINLLTLFGRGAMKEIEMLLPFKKYQFPINILSLYTK